jgi:hypothetical protein
MFLDFILSSNLILLLKVPDVSENRCKSMFFKRSKQVEVLVFGSKKRFDR